MKRYKKYVYYLALDYYGRRLNLNILNLETNDITLFVPHSRYTNLQLRKRLGINFLRNIEITATNPHIRTTRLFNEESRDRKYRKLIKKIKNYKRDWWKGDMERTIRGFEMIIIFIGGV